MASDNYAEWLASSTEWATLRLKVFTRARGRCEACGDARADVVHHLTYKYGRLPPLWCLKAVCDDCHDGLHDPNDEWCLPGMERQ
jgi:5-methylcytosine-specific restriction endonuclease McrA